MIGPAMTHPREGWAEASKRLATEGDDALVWPEFANEEDDLLTWPGLDLDEDDAPSSRASEAQTRNPS